MLPAIIFFMFRLGTVALSLSSESAAVASFNVTVAYFSGHNDPEWTVSPNREIARLLSAEGRKRHSPEDMPSKLGYKGMLVEDLITNAERLFVGPETSELQLKLLETIPSGLLKSGDLEEIRRDISSGKITAINAKGRSKRYAPPYDPEHWNFIPVLTRQLCNNCYNYANRKATNTFAQPGYSGGQQYTTFTMNDLVTASQRDNLTLLDPHPRPQDPVPGPPASMSQHLVALVVRPETPNKTGDFHWYRLDDNGHWSHKPGQTPVTNVDGEGAVIVDPRNVSFGGYEFAKFMVSDMFQINIGGNYLCPDYNSLL